MTELQEGGKFYEIIDLIFSLEIDKLPFNVTMSRKLTISRTFLLLLVIINVEMKRKGNKKEITRKYIDKCLDALSKISHPLHVKINM